MRGGKALEDYAGTGNVSGYASGYAVKYMMKSKKRSLQIEDANYCRIGKTHGIGPFGMPTLRYLVLCREQVEAQVPAFRWADGLGSCPASGTVPPGEDVWFRCLAR